MTAVNDDAVTTDDIPLIKLIIFFSYMGIGVILFFVFFFMNGGLRKKDLSKIQKPPEMGYDEFQSILNYFQKRQEKAQYVFVAFIPFPVIILVDYFISFVIRS